MYMQIQHRRTCVYQIGYHIVFCTKYRKAILLDKLCDDSKQVILTIAKEKGFDIVQMEINEDHVHLFISALPHVSISTLVKWIKGISARRLFELNPSLKKQLYRGHLWNPSYYIGTVGDMSEDVVRRYIESQKSKAGKEAQI